MYEVRIWFKGNVSSSRYTAARWELDDRWLVLVESCGAQLFFHESDIDAFRVDEVTEILKTTP